MWLEESTTMAIFVEIVAICLSIFVLKIVVSMMLMTHINWRYIQDIQDSSDDLDKDVIERLSSIEKYTILRSDSAMAGEKRT